MEATRVPGAGRGVEDTAHFIVEAGAGEVHAWEEIEAGRYMPRRIRGSYQGRALG